MKLNSFSKKKKITSLVINDYNLNMHNNEQQEIQLLICEHHKLPKYYLLPCSTNSYLFIYFVYKKK